MWLTDWLDNLTETIVTGLAGLLAALYNTIFATMHDQLNDIADSASETPHEFGESFEVGGATLNEIIGLVLSNAIIPVAVVIFAFFVMYEFITMVMDKNNFKEFDTSIFIKWALKICICLYVLLNTTFFVNGIFEIGAFIVQRAGLTGEGIDEIALEGDMFTAFNVGYLILLLVQGILLYLGIWVVTILAHVVIINRILEAILLISVAPIPFATFANQEFGSIGKNYVKSLFALALQGFFIVLILIVYQIMIASALADVSAFDHMEYYNQTIFEESEAFAAFSLNITMSMIYSAVLAIMLFKTSSISKGILNAS
jgi:hypothetical protein